MSHVDDRDDGDDEIVLRKAGAQHVTNFATFLHLSSLATAT